MNRQFDYLLVYKSPYNKIRLGKNNDGGYVIADIPDVKYDLFLSGGVSNDDSFEMAFLNKYQNIPCIMFDGTCDYTPKLDNVQFIKKNLGKINDDKISNFESYFDNYNDIFVKLDIEGGENELFESITDDNLKKIKQLVIEFHSARQITIPTRLSKTHWLIHLHGNNCGGVSNIDGIDIPNVFECTYIRKDNINDLELNNVIIPHPKLDQPNKNRRRDITLIGYPFNILKT